MLQAAPHGVLVLGARQSEVGGNPEPLQPLAHDVLEQLPGPLSADRIGVKDSDGRRPYGPRLENGTALLDDVDDGLQVVLGNREGSALYRCNPLSRNGIAEIQRCGDDHAGGAVDLFQKLVVHQYATVFGGQQIGSAPRRQADLEAAAPHLAGDRANRVVLADFALLQFGYPNGFHAFGFQYPNVFVADDMPLGQQLLPAGTENGATKDPSS